MATRRQEIRRAIAKLRRQIAALEHEIREIDYAEAMKNQVDMFESRPTSSNEAA